MTRILCDIRGAVAHVRLNRPERRNALDGALLDELGDALEKVAREKGARVVVLGGEGKVFCAGADIDWMREEGKQSAGKNRESARRLASLYELLDTLPVPLVARVQGAAIGGGVGLVAVCDIAVAAGSSFFALSEVRLGLVPAVVSPYVLAKIGAARARDVMLTARRFTADEALAWGLLHRVAPEDALDDAVATVVGDLLSAGPEALARSKRLIREVGGLRPDRVADLTAGEIAEARAGAEAQAGLEAFLGKTSPPWKRGDGNDPQ